jgi:NAD(P)H-hydrate epimerase
VIDAGSLQMMEVDWIPKGAILTPNQKEFKKLFGMEPTKEAAQQMAKKHRCFIVLKGSIEGPQVYVCSPEKSVSVEGGNAGLTKGGTGDVLAGLTLALAAKNEPFLAGAAAAWLANKAADELYKQAGFAYNADDLAEKIPEVLGKYLR